MFCSLFWLNPRLAKTLARDSLLSLTFANCGWSQLWPDLAAALAPSARPVTRCSLLVARRSSLVTRQMPLIETDCRPDSDLFSAEKASILNPIEANNLFLFRFKFCVASHFLPES